MIDRASAEISKCIMRLKRKDNKQQKPPEIPPKPTQVSSNFCPSPGGVPVLPPIRGGSGPPTPSTPHRKFSSLPRRMGGSRRVYGSLNTLILTPQDLFMNDDFLKRFFNQYFVGNEKLVLPIVCKKWRDVSYSMGKSFWGDLIPSLRCKELRGLRPDISAGIRRRFYGGLVKRGFRSLKLHAATDEDAEDVIIHYSQGSTLVESLKIVSSGLSDKGLFNLLDHLSSLQDLELCSCNEVTEDGLNAALPVKLNRLVILDCIHVADPTIAFIAKTLPCLQYFEVQAYHVTDAALSAFNPKTNSALSTLKLNSCWELTNQAVLHIVSGLPQIKHLSLSGCSKITDEGIEVLAENLQFLRSLDLSWCPRITDATLECIACDLNALEALILDRCSLITDLGIGYLATMSSLRVLSVRWCTIKDGAIHHIISMKRLRFLSLAGCTNISPSTLCSLSTLKGLQELELTNCGITSPVLQFLKNTLNCIIIE